MTFRLPSLALAAWVIVCSFPPAARAQPADPLAGETVVAIWNEATLEAIREASIPAPIAARALAIVNTAMYDAWSAYDSAAIGTDGTARLKRLVRMHDERHMQRAIAIAAFYALRDVCAVPMADTTLAQTGQPLGQGDEAERIGQAAAAAVLATRHNDGSNQLGDRHAGFYSDYTAYHAVNTPERVADPNHWQPLLVYHEDGSFRTQHFLVPQWGDVRPFAADIHRLTAALDAPAHVGEAKFQQQAQDLLDISAQLTDRQKAIAEYWSDGMMTDSPPGHWMRFGIWISKRDRHDAGTDARMFFTLSNALLDAGILCWHVKRVNDSERPITAIHALFAGRTVRAWAGPGKGTAAIDGAAWQPYQPPEVVTPAFPEFFSGHSTFSAAAAEVLRRFTGSDRFGASYTQLPGTSIVDPGEPRRPVTLAWATFSQAADEAGMSRRYGGIHFEDADLAGRRSGRAVGAAAYDRAHAFITGTIENGAPGMLAVERDSVKTKRAVQAP